MRRRWQTVIGLVISAAALVLALIGIDFHQVAAALAHADYRYLIPNTILVVLYLLARAVRWQLLLDSRISLARCFWVTNIGYLMNNILPFRLGDPARALVISQGGKISLAAALSTVIVERVLDMLTVVALLGAVAPFVAGSGEAVGVGIVAGSVALAVAGVLLLLAFRPDWGQWAVRWILERVPRLNTGRWTRAADGFFDGLAPLRSGRRGLAILFWSAVAWALVVLGYWTMLLAFLTRPPFLAAPFLVCLLGLGMAIPSSPSAVGVFHAIARYGLTIPFSVPPEEAVTAAFAIHAIQYIQTVSLGLFALARESLSVSDITRSAETLSHH